MDATLETIMASEDVQKALKDENVVQSMHEAVNLTAVSEVLKFGSQLTTQFLRKQQAYCVFLPRFSIRESYYQHPVIIPVV